jgi:hypothetical protein
MMTSTKTFTVSQHYAKLILAAWERRDFTGFQGILDQIGGVEMEDLPPAERERTDLIRDLARNILLWETSRRKVHQADLNAASVLIRHLGGSPD